MEKKNFDGIEKTKELLSEMEMLNVVGGATKGGTNGSCAGNDDCSHNGTCAGNGKCHNNGECYLMPPLPPTEG